MSTSVSHQTLYHCDIDQLEPLVLCGMGSSPDFGGVLSIQTIVHSVLAAPYNSGVSWRRQLRRRGSGK
jgi:hypothetical protein